MSTAALSPLEPVNPEESIKPTDMSQPDDSAAATTNVLLLLQQVDALVADDKLLAAQRLLRPVAQHPDVTDHYRAILDLGTDCADAIRDLRGDPLALGWTKYGERFGSYPTVLYYKLQDRARLTCRLETPIVESLLIPLLSVLNEAELYTDWMPSWQRPRIGVRSTETLEKSGRANQILKIIGDVPWPFAPRLVIMQAIACDEIDDAGFCAVRLHNVEEKDMNDKVNTVVNTTIKKEKMEQVEIDGIFMFEKCPPHHPVVAGHPDYFADLSHRNHDERLVLVTFKMYCDARMTTVPQFIINFIIKSVITKMWDKLLCIAQSVHDGQRPRHQEAIASQPEFYAWMEQRVRTMLQKWQPTEESETTSI